MGNVGGAAAQRRRGCLESFGIEIAVVVGRALDMVPVCGRLADLIRRTRRDTRQDNLSTWCRCSSCGACVVNSTVDAEEMVTGVDRVVIKSDPR